MEIMLNGEPRKLDSGATVQHLVESFSLPTRRIAVELNRNVVPRKNWPDVVLKHGDSVEVVHFVGGG